MKSQKSRARAAQPGKTRLALKQHSTPSFWPVAGGSGASLLPSSYRKWELRQSDSRWGTGLIGSADLSQASDRLPINSINFITCHDGFTLNDLVAYNVKHNKANGENNRDGMDENDSWNCGIEGETDDKNVESLRRRQIKTFMTILMLSQGVPMFLSGDEVQRTQRGNNNAYCQDNETSWFDWKLIEKNAESFRFFQQIIQFRKRHRVLHQGYFFTGEIDPRGLADIVWHQQWQIAVDTDLASPNDVVAVGQKPLICRATYRVKRRSSVVLISASTDTITETL